MIFNDLTFYGRLGITWISLIFFIPGKVAHGRCHIVLSFSVVNAAIEKGLYLYFIAFFSFRSSAVLRAFCFNYCYISCPLTVWRIMYIETMFFFVSFSFHLKTFKKFLVIAKILSRF